MGTVNETLAVYGFHGLLWLAALHRMGAKPVLAVLLTNMAASWWAGEALAGNDRAVAMILIDLASILALMEFHTGPHERLVAAIALSMILWRTANYVIVSYTGRYGYAVALNCAVTAQLFIAGGYVDQWGRRVDYWLSRLHPRLARAVRDVAT